MTTEVAAPPRKSWLQSFFLGRNPRFTLVRVLVLILTTFVLFRFVLVPIEVVGVSMEPSFVEGQIRLVSKRAYLQAKPQRGDVVAVRMKSERVVLLKRIIGLPGERVQFLKKKILINGEPLEEPYVKPNVHPSWSERGWAMIIPADCYLVVGDNRSMRFEDHFRYLAGRDEIIGKVVY